MTEAKKIICPDVECAAENDANVDACSKCGLDIAGFLGIDRIFRVRENNAKKAEEEKKKKQPLAEPRRKSGFAGLIGGKK